VDDGTGVIFPNSNPTNPTTPATNTTNLDDDRTLTVTAYGPVNEGSTWAPFVVTATPGQTLNLALGVTGDVSDRDATITNFTVLEYSLDGETWQPYSAGNRPVVPPSGIVFVRVNITSEQDDPFEGPENFTLTASYATGGSRSATGISTIIDNGTGTLFSGNFSGGNPVTFTGTLDDDRGELSIPDVTVNENSPYVVFRIAGASGQSFSLALANGAQDFAAGDATATAGQDYLNAIEVYNGTTWIPYNPGSSVSIPEGGSLLIVRIPILDDDVFEGAHAFTITATPTTGPAVSGRAIIGDFGTGAIFNDSGSAVLATARDPLTGQPYVYDDDRTIRVNSPFVNEGSEHVVFTVTGVFEPVSLGLNIGSGTGFASIPVNLQYFDGNGWVTYTGGNVLAPAGGGLLYVQVNITAEQDPDREGAEIFDLVVTSSDTSIGSSSGTATIRDDGSGQVWLGDSFTVASPAQLTAANFKLDDDFDKDGILPTTEDALSSLAASQGIGDAQEGDLNGDGILDSEQNALATLAWRRTADFIAGNEGTLTDSRPIISLAVVSGTEGTAVSNTLQLENIRVASFADSSEFNSATSAVQINADTGVRTVNIVNGPPVTTTWDPIRFELAPQNAEGTLVDIDGSRGGVQVRIYIDLRASGLTTADFNRYIKFVSAGAIAAAGPAGLVDLDGRAITQEGWYDFTQRTPGGDGARFVTDAAGTILGIELILTDNAFGDNDLSANRIFDPGVLALAPKVSNPVQVQPAFRPIVVDYMPARLTPVAAPVERVVPAFEIPSLPGELFVQNPIDTVVASTDGSIAFDLSSVFASSDQSAQITKQAFVADANGNFVDVNKLGWLTFDPETGLLTGKFPQGVDSIEITLEAVDQNGNRVTTTFTVTRNALSKGLALEDLLGEDLKLSVRVQGSDQPVQIQGKRPLSEQIRLAIEKMKQSVEV
jgi:hypothetical protein